MRYVVNVSRISGSVDVAALGRALYEAERDRRAIAPLTSASPDITPEDAYAIQEAYAALRVADGARLAGRKIGATSKAIQQLFGIDTPDYGHVFDDMVVPDGGTIERAALIQPMVEPELAFILDTDLAGPSVTRDDVLAVTREVIGCIEVIDSRIAEWKIAFADTVADNGSSARAVFSSDRIPIDGLDLATVEAELVRNGERAGVATGSAVLGHPAEAVAWLANSLGGFGRTLRAGEYVLSGSFMTAVPAEAGDTFEARFSGVGAVSCSFV